MCGDDDRMLRKILRALMAYYGPMKIIQSVVSETDVVITEMAVAGHMKQAKEFANKLEDIRIAMRDRPCG